ncbi:MAG: DUF1501 domain-containing protein [Deltaproteobacteria bacterium]|nr:MAG: DUF1501 domain-containing protein [Deltaproteobacteria bacterium]
MRRRNFIHSIFWGSLLAGTGFHFRNLQASPFPGSDKRTLVNLLLEGGPDFRHLLVPEFKTDGQSYGNNYWTARATAHRINATNESMEARWKQYLRVEKDGVVFGIHPKAEWLKDMFQAGNVAIINNALHSTTRDHAHSLLVLQSGDMNTGRNDRARSGWGGRLAQLAKGRVISMTPFTKLFCNGEHPTNPLDHDNSSVLSGSQLRQFALYYPEILKTNPDANGSEAVLTRALRSYYEANRKAIPTNSPFYRFVQHEKVLRELSDQLTTRLKSVPVPSGMKTLFDNESSNLVNRGFGLQLRNLYDAFACADILDFRVGSIAYEGWDSHKHQINSIEPKFEDIFGKGKGLDLLFQALQKDMPKAYENLVLVISGEFGRQLMSNGDEGTDHGRGNSILLIGKNVKGGIYGDMFPANEIQRFRRPNEDIRGLTGIDRVFAEVCNWVESGSGDTIFSNHKSSPLEQGLDLGKILS